MTEEETKIQLTGILDWKQFREVIMKQFEKASTEEEFLNVIQRILFSTSHSEEEMQKKRRMLGIPET